MAVVTEVKGLGSQEDAVPRAHAPIPIDLHVHPLAHVASSAPAHRVTLPVRGGHASTAWREDHRQGEGGAERHPLNMGSRLVGIQCERAQAIEEGVHGDA